MLDLSSLDDKEKKEALALLKTLGVDVNDLSNKPKRKRVIVILKSYVNCYENRCTTCGSIEMEYYLMKQVDGTDILRGLPIPASQVDTTLDIQTQVKKRTTCNQCYTRLGMLTKEDLIKLLIKEKLKWI